MEPKQGEATTLDNNHNKDRWEIDTENGKIVKFHTRPRLALFVPQADHCPVPISQLSKKRTTKIHYQDGHTEEKSDQWSDDGNDRLLHDRWTGSTTFELVSCNRPEQF